MSRMIILRSSSTVASAARASNWTSRSTADGSEATARLKSPHSFGAMVNLRNVSDLTMQQCTTSYRHHTRVRQRGLSQGSSTITTLPICLSIAPICAISFATSLCRIEKASTQKNVAVLSKRSRATNSSSASSILVNEHCWAWLTKSVAGPARGALSATLPTSDSASDWPERAVRSRTCCTSSTVKVSAVAPASRANCRRKAMLTPSSRRGSTGGGMTQA
mmetsp:Transcript_5864/g.15016  ORF Transcript_5864/g.15016 Transcript_5864/m.15016 type:complete len:220 (-) Transcript_5864:121-780(-)